MRLIVFFDLPMETPAQRKEYTRFRKWLLRNGYLMLQKSVYSKLAIDGRMVSSLMVSLEMNKPKEGRVQALKVTEKQYADMRTIVGGVGEKEELDSTEGLIVI